MSRMQTGKQVTFRILRRRRRRAQGSRSTRSPPRPVWVVLDAVLNIQAQAGARSGRALELQGRQVRLVQRRSQRQAASDVQDAPGRPRHVAARRRPSDQELSRTSRTWSPTSTGTTRSTSSITPFTPAKDADFTYYQEDVDRVQEFRKCIECFLCQNVCHVLRNHEAHDRFAGPRFFVRIAGLEMHPMDTADRTDVLAKEAGVGSCATSPSAAPKSAPKTSTSPTTPSSRSRSASSIARTTPCSGWCAR